MFERDPELERLLAPEKGEPPPPSDALRERLWRRLRQSLETRPVRGPGAGGGLLVLALLVGAGLGGWLLPRSPMPVEAVPTLPATGVVAPPPDAAVAVIAPPVVEPAPVPERPAALIGARVPAPAAFDAVGSRVDLRGALRDAELARAAQLLAEHERRAPGDDLTEEREALLVRVALFTRTPDARDRLAAFRSKFPRSVLVTGPEAPVPAEAPPSAPSAWRTCSLTGRLTFTTTDANVRASDVVVYVADGKRKGQPLPPAMRHELAQVKKQFSRRTLIVQRADSVAFPNLDAPTEHSVFSSDRTTVRIKPTPKAEPEPVTVTKEGGFRLQCDLHQAMRAWVMVVPDRSLATQPADDGTWRIDGVRAGRHTLKVAEPNGATAELQVTACAGDTPVELSLEGKEAPVLKRFNGAPYGEYQQ